METSLKQVHHTFLNRSLCLFFSENRLLINQAHSEKRVILTRDTKLLKHQYLIRNQVYQVKGLLKNEQLLEVFSFAIDVSL